MRHEENDRVDVLFRRNRHAADGADTQQAAGSVRHWLIIVCGLYVLL